MSNRFNPWLLVLCGVFLSRFFGMALFPLLDKTEPRYAEIARLMAETGDWITPWFEPGVPFWGKPPLSFWAQAASINVFGLSEFTLRLPSWIVTVMLVWLIWRLSRLQFGASAARWTALVFSTMLLPYTSAGAVMTDVFFTLGTTLSLVSFSLVVAGQQSYWRWLFFLGLVVGLLSKGPLTLVLTGVPIVLWMLVMRQRMATLGAFPWIYGTLFTALVTLPWYILAEIKTPGFFDYFIVGEHIQRFLEPKWGGDLYGRAHMQPKGMIWVFWLLASFPWGIVAVGGMILAMWRGTFTTCLRSSVKDPAVVFLLLCALAPLLFFSLASNTLWTYPLPSLPFTAVLIARWVATFGSEKAFRLKVTGTVLAPFLLTLGVVVGISGLTPLDTEKQLIAYYEEIRKPGDSPLMYLDKLPFSARFYSLGRAQEVTIKQVQAMAKDMQYRRYNLVVPQGWPTDQLGPTAMNIAKKMENRRYQLLSFGFQTFAFGQELPINIQ